MDRTRSPATGRARATIRLRRTTESPSPATLTIAPISNAAEQAAGHQVPVGHIQPVPCAEARATTRPTARTHRAPGSSRASSLLVGTISGAEWSRLAEPCRGSPGGRELTTATAAESSSPIRPGKPSCHRDTGSTCMVSIAAGMMNAAASPATRIACRNAAFLLRHVRQQQAGRQDEADPRQDVDRDCET